MDFVNHLFAEGAQVVPAIMPVDLNDGANPGDWVSLKEFGRCTIAVLANNGTAANDITVTVNQATDVSGTGSKALPFERIATKQATALTAVGQYTEVEQTASETYTDGTNGEDELLYLIDITPDMLDSDNDFDCVQVSLNQAGAAKIGCALYILTNPRHAGAPADLPSAIAD